MSATITQAILLSAGFGTRMREITKGDIPKVMVPLLGKPLLEWHIEQFKGCGIKEFFINLHYLPEKIIEYFDNGSKWGVKINYFLEHPEILGTAGGIKNFERYLADNFFVIYADTFYKINYQNIISFYFSKEDAIGITTGRITDHPKDSDLAVIGPKNEVLEFLTKPHKGIPKKDFLGTSAPYIFSRKILEYIPASTYYEIDHNLVPDLLKRGNKYYIYKLKEEEFRKDVGTPERYRFVEDYLKSKPK